MKFIVLLGIISFNFHAKAYSFQDYTVYVDENMSGNFYMEDLAKSNISVDSDIPSLLAKDENIFNSTVNSSEVETNSSKKFDEVDKKDKSEESGVKSTVDVSSRVQPTSAKVASEKVEAELSPETHNQNNSNHRESSLGDTSDLIASPSRREINALKASDDFFKGQNKPWTYDVYYPREKYSHNDYVDYGEVIPQRPFKQRNNSMKNIPKKPMEPNRFSEPQYFQKNYYYNYYPPKNQDLVPDINNREKEYKPEEPYYDRRINKIGRYERPSPCKMYLEFLKYAFEKLDRSSDYQYEFGDNYDEFNQWNPPRNYLTMPLYQVENSEKDSREEQYFRTASKANTHDTEMEASTTMKLKHDRQYQTEITIIAPNYNSMPTKPTFLPTDPNNYGEMPTRPTFVDQNEQGDFSEYDYEEEKTTYPKPRTSLSYWFPDHDYVKLRNPSEKVTPKFITTNIISTNNAGSMMAHYTSTPYPFAVDLRNRFDKKVMKTIKTTDDLEKTEDADCNDKMLPCPDTYNVTYPLNGYCNRYVSCESGKAIRRTCPDGLHFNIITKSCDLPHNSFCTFACSESNGYFGVPGDCGGYFICKNFVAEYRMCPPRMHWDIHNKLCTFNELSACPMKCSKPIEIKPYNGDCGAYVICFNSIPYYHKCPPNTKFDKNSSTCIPKNLSKCKDDNRLMIRKNPNYYLCQDVEAKVGSKVWCAHFNQYPQK